MLGRMANALRKTSIVAALLAATLLAPSLAEAHDRPLYAGFGGGPHVDLDCCNVHGRLQGEFGIHFSRDDRGFFLAFEAINTFGDDFYMFLGGVRLGGDIEVYGRHDYGILLRPSVLVGFGWRDYSGPYNHWGDWGVFVVQPAFDVRFVFAHRVLALWLRPASFDFNVYLDRYRPNRELWWGVGYQFMLGLDFQFG